MAAHRENIFLGWLAAVLTFAVVSSAELKTLFAIQSKFNVSRCAGDYYTRFESVTRFQDNLQAFDNLTVECVPTTTAGKGSGKGVLKLRDGKTNLEDMDEWRNATHIGPHIGIDLGSCEQGGGKVATIQRFKGLDKELLILITVKDHNDPVPEGNDDEESRERKYSIKLHGIKLNKHDKDFGFQMAASEAKGLTNRSVSYDQMQMVLTVRKFSFLWLEAEERKRFKQYCRDPLFSMIELLEPQILTRKLLLQYVRERPRDLKLPPEKRQEVLVYNRKMVPGEEEAAAKALKKVLNDFGVIPVDLTKWTRNEKYPPTQWKDIGEKLIKIIGPGQFTLHFARKENQFSVKSVSRKVSKRVKFNYVAATTAVLEIMLQWTNAMWNKEERPLWKHGPTMAAVEDELEKGVTWDLLRKYRGQDFVDEIITNWSFLKRGVLECIAKARQDYPNIRCELVHYFVPEQFDPKDTTENNALIAINEYVVVMTPPPGIEPRFSGSFTTTTKRGRKQAFKLLVIVYRAAKYPIRERLTYDAPLKATRWPLPSP